LTAQKEFEALLHLYHEADAQDQKVTILKALGATADRDVMDKVMEFTMSPHVRDQDVYYPIGFLAHNTAARTFVWEWSVRGSSPFDKT